MTSTAAIKNQPPTLPAGFFGNIFGGHFAKFRRHPTVFLTRAAALGDVSKFMLGSQPMFFINHPDLARDVFVTNHHKFYKGRALQRMKRVLGNGLLTSETEFHLRQRRLAQPAFHRQRIAGYAAAMIELGEKVSGDWRGGKIYDVSEEMMRLTLYIVAKTLFGANVEDEADEIGAAMTTMISMFNLLMLPFSELLEKLPLPQAKRFRQAKETVDRVIYQIIRDRRESGADAGDLLSMLLLAQDEDDGGKMTDEQVRDEALTLFLAGHETTANALVWTWYLLAEHPEIEARFHQELNEVLPEKRLPTPADYTNLKFTEAVLAESMRLYPPAWAVGRLAIEDHELNGFAVSKGSLILLSPFVTGRDARFWQDADRFKPERWLAETSIKEASQKFVYFPFGGGVRRCIGEQFAWMEGVLLLATIGRKWRLELLPNQKVELNPLITLRPKYGMKMTAVSRS